MWNCLTIKIEYFFTVLFFNNKNQKKIWQWNFLTIKIEYVFKVSFFNNKNQKFFWQ